MGGPKLRILVAVGSGKGPPTEPRAATQPRPWELIFIPFGDLCRVIRSSRRREAAGDRRKRGAPNNRTVERERRLPRRRERPYRRLIRMEAGEWGQGRW
jgi:hypothetical protein